ncbi:MULTISPECIES: SMODS domain-containing nucleotidyltransferase [Bacillus]|uniref:SMODS domain-containing nucleotidyltransferase n=1 Tax=Bacillus TaxID=1386 RepID=UPI000BEE2E5A|nr:nucleotidyltransferase [Bacillus thuringiensis]PDZ93371.1 nucleotidyltransferase [Bacillus thuringiensis]
MKLSSHFKLFISNLSLNTGRNARINSALVTWEELLSTDDELSEKYKEFYPQGSYATETAIRPSDDGEFDVDVILLLDVKKDNSKEFFKWVLERVKTKKAYKDRIKPKDRCIQINYAGDFHVDIVPSRTTQGDSILIPSKKEDDWVKTNPVGFKKWCSKKQIKHDGKFQSIVKILKYWRDQNVSSNSAPKSILLTTLIGHYMVAKNSYAETLVETTKNMVTKLTELIEGKEDDEVIQICNPSLEEENLARDWTVKKCRIFKSKLETLYQQCLEAFEESNKETSIAKWQMIFGTKKFPSELPEGAKMASAVATGSVFVNADGILNQNNQGAALKEHRFFGVNTNNEKI